MGPSHLLEKLLSLHTQIQELEEQFNEVTLRRSIPVYYEIRAELVEAGEAVERAAEKLNDAYKTMS